MPDQLNGQSELEELSREDLIQLLKEKNNQSSPQDGLSFVKQLVGQLGIKTDATKLQSHGLTIAEMEDLRLRMINGQEIEKISANRSPDYLINKHEAHLVHVALRVDDWDKGINRGVIKYQKFYLNEFRQMSETVSKPGQKNRPQKAFSIYDYVKILHMPEADKNKELVKKLEAKKPASMNFDELLAAYQVKFGTDAPDNITPVELVGLLNQR